jgi:hypothetical protein
MGGETGGFPDIVNVLALLGSWVFDCLNGRRVVLHDLPLLLKADSFALDMIKDCGVSLQIPQYLGWEGFVSARHLSCETRI